MVGISSAESTGLIVGIIKLDQEHERNLTKRRFILPRSWAFGRYVKSEMALLATLRYRIY